MLVVGRALELELSQLRAADLPGQRLPELGDELDSAWIRVRGEPFANVGLDVVGEMVARLVAVGEHDERLDDGAAQLVRRGDDGSLLDGGMLEADGLDLERADPVAGRDDHVVGTADVPEV